MPVTSGLTQPGVRGRVFYVGTTNSSTGIVASDTGYGALGDTTVTYGIDPFYPFATLAYCITYACVAGRGDVVYICPGTTITVTDTLALSKAGVTIIGMGNRDSRPVISFITNTTANASMTAAGVKLQNVTLSCGIDQQVAMLNVSAADCIVQDCEFAMTATLSATNYALIGILTTSGADRLLVKDCVFTGSGAGAAAGTVRHTNAVQIVGGDGITLQGGQMRGRFSATLGNIQVVTTAATNLTVQDMYLSNSTTSAAKVFVDTITGTTGFLNGLRMQILTGSAPITAATMAWGLNYYKATIATAMTVI